MTPRLLGALAALSAALTIFAAPWALDLQAAIFVFKPLTTVLIIAFAWTRGENTPVLRRWVIAGLVLSLGGDIALLWPREGFLPGLVSFLLAHLAYLVAFTRVQRLAARVVPFVVYAAVAGTVLWLLWPGVPGALRGPVVAYVLCLASMGAQAAVVWRAGGEAGGDEAQRARLLALGGALFVASDALLATNKFAAPLPAASLWILASYWAAQWCIAAWLAPRSVPHPLRHAKA